MERNKRYQVVKEILQANAGEDAIKKVSLYYITAKNYERARAWLYRGLVYYPSNPWFHHNYAIIMNLSNKPISAIKHSRIAHNLSQNHPLYISTHLKLLSIYGLNGELVEVARYCISQEIPITINSEKILDLLLIDDDTQHTNMLINQMQKKSVEEFEFLQSKMYFAQNENALALQSINLSGIPSANFAVEKLDLLLRNAPEHLQAIDIETQTSRLMDTVSLNNTRVRLLYLLGDYKRRCGQHEAAFEYYIEANALDKQRIKRNIHERLKSYKVLKNKFLSLPYRARNIKNPPIFIMGLPRSGTSVLEVVLSQFSEVEAKGELPFLNLAYEQLKTNLNDPQELQTLYMQLVEHNQKSITDKMPLNFDLIPLVIKSFPNSKIFLTSREFYSQIFAIFTKRFNSANYYCSNLKDIYDYLTFYNSEKQFYKERYPEQIFEFDLDKFHNQKLETIKSICAFLNEPFRENYLSYSSARYRPNTMSNEQVTMHNFSPNDDWKHYLAWISSELNIADSNV